MHKISVTFCLYTESKKSVVVIRMKYMPTMDSEKRSNVFRKLLKQKFEEVEVIMVQEKMLSEGAVRLDMAGKDHTHPFLTTTSQRRPYTRSDGEKVEKKSRLYEL